MLIKLTQFHLDSQRVPLDLDIRIILDMSRGDVMTMHITPFDGQLADWFLSNPYQMVKAISLLISSLLLDTVADREVSISSC